MARVDISTVLIVTTGKEFEAEKTAIGADGLAVPNDGRVYLLLKNITAGIIDVTIPTPVLFDTDLSLNDRVISVPANDMVLAGPFNRNLYNQNDNVIHLDVAGADADDIEVVAFKM